MNNIDYSYFESLKGEFEAEGLGRDDLAAESLFAAAEAMEPWAVKELLDRLDGKAVQQTELTGLEGAPLLSGIQVTFVKPADE